MEIINLPSDIVNNIKALEVPADKRKYQNRLTKFEKARILSLRTQQLKNGAKPLIKPEDYNLTYNCNNYYYEIAVEELKKKIIPFKIRRFDQNGKFETWDIQELAIIDFTS